MATATAINCTAHPDYLAYYGKLIGATIGDVWLIGDEYTHPLPVLAVRFADGTKGLVELWSDAEGNGAGHAHVQGLDALGQTD